MKIRITELGAPMTKAESIAQAIAKSQNPNLMRATVIFKSWRELELKIEDVSGPIQRFPKVGANLIAPEWRLPIPGIHHTALHAEIYAEHSHSTPVIRFVLKLFAAENRTLSYEPFEWFIRIALKPVELHFGEFGEDGPELHVTKDVDIYGVLRLIGGWNLPAAKCFFRPPRAQDILGLVGHAYEAWACLSGGRVRFNAISWKARVVHVQPRREAVQGILL